MSASRRFQPGRSIVLPVNLSRVPFDGRVGVGFDPAIQVGLLAAGVLLAAADAEVDGDESFAW